MLRLSELEFSYSKNPAVAKINLDFKKGEILVLAGLNGSGKSTILKLALGLLVPKKGKVLLEGRPISDYGLSQRSKKISMLDAVNHVNFPITVGELVEIAIRGQDPGKANEKLQWLYKSFDMEGLKQRSLLELSTGQMKRAFLMHLLASDSEIYMIDEPFSFLDWPHQKLLVEILKAMRDKFGSTIVAAVHEPHWTVKLADRVALVSEGQVIQVGASLDVFRSKVATEIFGFTENELKSFET